MPNHAVAQVIGGTETPLECAGRCGCPALIKCLLSASVCDTLIYESRNLGRASGSGKVRGVLGMRTEVELGRGQGRGGRPAKDKGEVRRGGGEGWPGRAVR